MYLISGTSIQFDILYILQSIAGLSVALSFVGIGVVTEWLMEATHLPAQRCSKELVNVRRLFAIALTLFAVQIAVALSGVVNLNVIGPYLAEVVAVIGIAPALAGLALLIKRKYVCKYVRDYMSAWIMVAFVEYKRLTHIYNAYEYELAIAVFLIASLFMIAISIVSVIIITTAPRDAYVEQASNYSK